MKACQIKVLGWPVVKSQEYYAKTKQWKKKEQQNLDGNSALSCRATTVKEMDGLLIFKSGIGKQFRGIV